MKKIAVLIMVVIFVGCAFFVFGQDGREAMGQPQPAGQTQSLRGIDTGDTSWVLISTALVMFMTPGLAFFYGDMVGRKNVLGILMQCIVVLCVISIQWVLYGYSLSFGPVRGVLGRF
jgi:hypothetical protein